MDPVKREPKAAEERVLTALVHAEPVPAEPVPAEQVNAQHIDAEVNEAEPSISASTISLPGDAQSVSEGERGAAPVAAGLGSEAGRGSPKRAWPAPATPRAYSGVSRIPRPLARLIVALFVVVHSLLAFGGVDWSRGQALTFVGLASVSLAIFWLGLSKSDLLPVRRTLGVLGLCGVTAVVMSFQVSPLAPEAFAHWHLGAITFVLVVLAVRGGLAAAWIAYVALLVITVLWTTSYGLSVADGLAQASRHAATLLAATLFAIGLRRSAVKLKVLHREGTERAVADATAVAAVEEREAHLARVNGLARPTLDLLARSYELDDEMRAECLLVEATLRDAMRGRTLFQGPVIPAARAARLRGVEVTLLDDCGDQPPNELAAVIAAVAGELSLLNSGRFTARLLPADRPNIATIVVAAAEHRILVITPSGEVRDD